MNVQISLGEILLRLLLTVIAGAIVGMNRGEHGHPAGLRTTILVCGAASISMIQMNLLLSLGGKTPASFAVLDLMRLPLGILSGMGFIGAGVILKKGDLILGVTTAATLWFVTVMGLCFGGGQIVLGFLALMIALLVLAGLKDVECRIKQDRRATVTVSVTRDGPSDHEIAAEFAERGLHIASWDLAYSNEFQQRSVTFVVHWRTTAENLQPPPIVDTLAHRPGVLSLHWKS